MNDKEKCLKLWEQRLKDYKASGLTIKSWCEVNEIKVHQFYYWKRKFKKKSEIKPSFIPIDLSHMNESDDSSLKVKIELEIKPGANQSKLKDVLKVLMDIC